MILILLLLFFTSPLILQGNTDKTCEIFWANQLLECSSDTISQKKYSPLNALGKYNVCPNGEKSLTSWSLPFGVRRNQFITVKFKSNIPTKQMVISENYNQGAIARVTLFDAKGKSKVIYDDPNPSPIEPRGRFFNLFYEDYDVDYVRITFNTTKFYDEYQVDAIGITNCADTIKPKVNLIKDIELFGQPEVLKEINSDYSELAPVISPDGKVLYFTRDGHPSNVGIDHQQDVWFATIDSTGKFNTPQNIGQPINNIYNNFAISITPDNNSLLLGNAYMMNQAPQPGLSISHRKIDGWDFPEKLQIEDYSSLSRYNSYSLGSDGKTLLLSVVREDSYGEHDIYASFMQVDGKWSKPMNLGNSLNSVGNEVSPFLASDNKTLYFSTNGYPGFGKNDIFVSRRLDDTWKNWSEPMNLGNKVNTNEWDAYFSTSAAGDYAYFVSSANKATSEDIFRIKLPTSAKPTSVVLISGKVLNSKTGEPLGAKIIYEELPSGKEAGVARSNPSKGEYTIALPAGKKYGFSASAEGYISINENIDLTQLTEFKEIKKDLKLVPIEKGEKVSINNIFFEFGKEGLLPESFPELNRLVKLMITNPNLKIRIEGHTDNIGNDKNNLLLSENRTLSVMNYLVENSIESNRLETKGYGKTKPKANNNTEEGRQQNRRVEIVILEK
jgi:outer membrane protein OmpA-like peptidoglycan-associated protein